MFKTKTGFSAEFCCETLSMTHLENDFRGYPNAIDIFIALSSDAILSELLMRLCQWGEFIDRWSRHKTRTTRSRGRKTLDNKSREKRDEFNGKMSRIKSDRNKSFITKQIRRKRKIFPNPPTWHVSSHRIKNLIHMTLAKTTPNKNEFIDICDEKKKSIKT